MKWISVRVQPTESPNMGRCFFGDPQRLDQNGRSSEMERQKDSRYSSKILGRYSDHLWTHALNFYLFALPEGMAQPQPVRKGGWFASRAVEAGREEAIRRREVFLLP